MLGGDSNSPGEMTGLEPSAERGNGQMAGKGNVHDNPWLPAWTPGGP